MMAHLSQSLLLHVTSNLPTHKFCSPHKLKRKSWSLNVHVLHLQTLVRGRVWLVGLHLLTQIWVKVFVQSVPFWHLMIIESYLASVVWFLQVVLKTSRYWQRLMVDPARSYEYFNLELVWAWESIDGSRARWFDTGIRFCNCIYSRDMVGWNKAKWNFETKRLGTVSYCV